jgi:hypothetical protein
VLACAIPAESRAMVPCVDSAAVAGPDESENSFVHLPPSNPRASEPLSHSKAYLVVNDLAARSASLLFLWFQRSDLPMT